MKYKYGTTHYDPEINAQYSIDNGVLYRLHRGQQTWRKAVYFTLDEVLNDPAVRKVKQ